ncbi:MAG: hypothetical protein K2R93_14475 [Gemmatimonadaceae bacterium]|nr:hypothetical protein [Gemmatimonadaceae bacterium]
MTTLSKSSRALLDVASPPRTQPSDSDESRRAHAMAIQKQIHDQGLATIGAKNSRYFVRSDEVAD